MIFSLVSPNLVHAQNSSIGENNVELELIGSQAYESEEEFWYYENLENEDYYLTLEIEEAIEEIYEDEVIENYNLEDYQIEYNYLETPIDSYVQESSPEFSARFLPFVLPALYATVVRQGTKILVTQTLKNGTKNLLTVRNGHLANKAHPVTKVKFNKNGFPIFESIHNYTLPDKYLKSTNKTQFKYANANFKAAFDKNPSKYKFTTAQKTDIKNGKTPRGYVWHHHQDRGKLQLVNKKIHDETGHTGGKSIWGK